MKMRNAKGNVTSEYVEAVAAAFLKREGQGAPPEGMADDIAMYLTRRALFGLPPGMPASNLRRGRGLRHHSDGAGVWDGQGGRRK